jgi:hypothetical protein
MKRETMAHRFFKLGLLSLTVLTGWRVGVPQAWAQPSVSADAFYDQLAPVGDWLYVSPYGRVWQPRGVGPDFRPYATSGHWVYTDYGWSFVSDYPWGWATFHYGRWALDPDYGWIWVPGYEWAPAWVDWRYGGGYIGWAPLAPFGARIVIEVHYRSWCFVPTRYFLERNFYHYAAPIDRVHGAFVGSAPARNEVVYSGTRWYAGPPPGRVAQEAGRPVQPVSVTPPAPGIIQPVRIGTPAGVPSSGPSARPPPGLPGPASPSPGAHFNPGAGGGPSHGQAVGGTPVNPAPPPRMPGQPGSPVGVPVAPYPSPHSGGTPVPAAPQPGPGPGAPGGIRMQPGPSPMPAAPPAGRSGTPAPHGQFMNPEPPRTMPVSPAPPTYHSVPYPPQVRMSPPPQAAPVRDHGSAMQPSMRYESPAIPRGAPVMNQAPASHPAPVMNQAPASHPAPVAAPAPSHGGGVPAHPGTSKFR